MDEQFLVETLRTLFELSHGGRPETGALARHLGVRPVEVGHALVELDRRGLVDATRARLTFRGLARAAAIQRLQPDRGSLTLSRGPQPIEWQDSSSGSTSERRTRSPQWPMERASESCRPTEAIG
ncbi:MAG: hypothetical protein ACOCV4_02695 [Myxococcota bacterium]